MKELFTEKQWIGEFFVPEQYEKRFSGKLEYSPETGVTLTYLITGLDIPAESDVLHGVLNSGEKCTLVGQFTPEHSGYSLKHGLPTRPGKVGFSCLLIGDWLPRAEPFFDINFSLTNMQEFFFPQGHKDFVKYSEKPLFSLNVSYGQIEIGNNATFGFLHDDITSQIYSQNTSALADLKAAFEGVKAKYPDSFFMFKEDIGYRIRLKIDAGADIRTIFGYVMDIANLFGLLTYSPVYPESLQILKRADGQLMTIRVFPSLVLDKRTIELCTKEKSHFLMPITNGKVDISAIMQTWLSSSKKYATMITALQHETGFRDEHSLHGEIVLYATQLESISYQNGVKEGKYEYPLITYASNKVLTGIKNILSKAGETNVNSGIGDLRNEIAHVGRPKRLLQSLSMGDMVRMSQFLQVAIIGYILTGLGVANTVIYEYQDKFTPE